jgi:hypothetical protein
VSRGVRSQFQGARGGGRRVWPVQGREQTWRQGAVGRQEIDSLGMRGSDLSRRGCLTPLDEVMSCGHQAMSFRSLSLQTCWVRLDRRIKPCFDIPGRKRIENPSGRADQGSEALVAGSTTGKRGG